MSFPPRNGYSRTVYPRTAYRSGYGGRGYGAGRVRVGNRYVYSSSPRPGFRPARGGGYYKRRSY